MTANGRDLTDMGRVPRDLPGREDGGEPTTAGPLSLRAHARPGVPALTAGSRSAVPGRSYPVGCPLYNRRAILPVVSLCALSARGRAERDGAEGHIPPAGLSG